MSLGDRPLTIRVRPPAQGSPAGARPQQQPIARTAPTADPLTNLQLVAPKAGEPGILPRPWLQAQAGPRQGLDPVVGPNPGSSGPPLPRAQSPTQPASSRQRSALLPRSPVRARHGVPQPTPLHAGPGS
ncbi:hypothetical protein NDU88_003234 [Pleurodeles waltl]|uniref:Uncharacterized protein n=1 Tax=Pleurodeles waltl TaxID=8319 RepID=A0AAV7UXX0_PLEWA|nr:hypothetical protein NDU88_003234 [Pleurodeles waltl]